MTEHRSQRASASESKLDRRLFLANSAFAIAGAMLPHVSLSKPLDSLLPRPVAYVPLDPARKIRLGIVGGGFGAHFQWHLHPNCTVQAVSDHRPDRRARLQEVYRCGTAYPSLEDLVKDDTIDAVAIFTGAPDHVRHTAIAMYSGKHVISAVPACVSLEQASKLVEIVKSTGLTYMLAETSWFQPEAIAAQALYKAGAFGDLFYSEVEYNHPISAKDREGHWYSNGKRTWRYGMAPMLYPTHATSFHISTTGETLTDVSCLGILAPDIPGYGIAENAYGNPFNAMMGLFSTSKGNVCRANVIWTGTNHGERAQWFGTKLSVFMPNRTSGQPFHAQQEHDALSLSVPDYQARLPESMRVSSAHGGSHPFLCHEFISAILEGRLPAIGLAEGLALTVPGIIAFESARRGGERLPIPSIV